MKVKFEWKYTDETPVPFPMIETYEHDSIVNQKSAEKYAHNLVDNFNDSLRPNEKHRTLVKVEFINEKSQKKHKWMKTNLVTIRGRYTTYDEMECDDCGVTGRRYGLEHVTRDEKYKAKIYEHCDTAQEQIKKLKLRERRRNKNES